MTERRRAGLWVRWAGEVAIIVASVFVAIYLEGVADDSGRSDDAHAALAQITAELRTDLENLAEIRQNQVELGASYDNLLRWFADPESLPRDSVQAALDHVAFLNRTMYPNQGAWRALTSAGQLSWIDDPGLVAKLANLYESTHVRLEYAGRDYDFNVNEVARVTVPRAWDAHLQEPRADGRAAMYELRGQLRYMRLAWNVYYIDLLDEYGSEMEALLRELDDFLASGRSG